MNSCWEESPQERPSFNELKAKLGKILEDSAENYGYIENYQDIDNNQYLIPNHLPKTISSMKTGNNIE